MLLTNINYLYVVVRHIEGTDRDIIDQNTFDVRKDWAIDKGEKCNEKHPEYAKMYPIIGVAQVKVIVNKMDNLENMCKEGLKR